jgi:hypothetical protein
MGERPADGTIGGRVEGEREPCGAIASLGFPIMFLALLAHGLAVFLVRNGFWAPGPLAEAAWTAIVGAGLAIGLVMSVWRGRASSLK